MAEGPVSRISDIFIRVLQAEPSRRPALIQELCGDDPALTRDISELVAAADRAPSTAAMVGQVIADEPPALQPGTHIRGYEIEHLIASGGMGMVYLAHDTALNRRVAIKAVKPSIAADADHRRRLKQEAQLMARLEGHPNIATVHALIDEDNVLYIVEEWLTGPTLRERLADGPLPVADALDVATAVLRALGAAHRQRIVHRDLKPENVMRTSTGGWKVLDFGIAKLDTPDPRTTLHVTQVDQRVGTPLYMSPEQLRGEPLDGRSDLFAFGILLYELLTRRHPFARRTEPDGLETWTAVLNDPPLSFSAEERERLPIGVPEVIARCLEKEPQQRWSSAEDVEAALRAIQNGTTPIALPASGGNEVFWWQFHEAAAAVVYWLTLVPVWHVRSWIGRTEFQVGGATLAVDARILFVALIATVALLSVLRFSFVFVSRHKPGHTHAHHARAIRWVRVGDLLYAAIMLTAGIMVSLDHQGWAILLVSLGLGSFGVAWFVEPLTERDALDALAPPRTRHTSRPR
jgi:tRNA A-37 threonylcarbamoyl transferase component Bud32